MPVPACYILYARYINLTKESPTQLNSLPVQIICIRLGVDVVFDMTNIMSC